MLKCDWKDADQTWIHYMAVEADGLWRMDMIWMLLDVPESFGENINSIKNFDSYGYCS
jgi:hypothetical protein